MSNLFRDQHHGRVLGGFGWPPADLRTMPRAVFVLLLVAALSGAVAGENCHDYGEAPCWLGSLDLNQIVATIEVHGTLTYAARYDPMATESSILVIDAGVPSCLAQVAELALPYGTHALEARDEVLLALNSELGLLTIDTSVPSSPAILAELDGFQDFAALASMGSVAYVVSPDELALVDTGDPASPTVVDRLGPGFGGTSVEVAGDLMAVLASDTLRIVSVSDAVDPLLLAAVAIPGAMQMGLRNGAAAVVTDTGLAIVDLATPESPELLAYDDFQHQYFRPHWVGESLVLQGWGEPVSTVIDLSDLTQPHLTGRFQLPDADYVYTLDSTGDLVQLMSFRHLYVLDLASGTFHPPHAEVVPAEITWSMDVSDGVMVVALEDDGVTTLGIFDVSVLDQPQPLASLIMPGQVFDILIDGDLVICRGVSGWPDTDEDMMLVDISSPLSPEIVGGVGLPNPNSAIGDLEVYGDHALVLAGDLKVVDISTPSAPQLVATLDVTPLSATSLDVSGDTAYVGGRPGVELIDISEVASPQAIGFIEAPTGDYRAVAIVADTGVACVSWNQWREQDLLSLYDVSDPENPRELSRTCLASGVSGAELRDELLYCAAAGNPVYSILDPTDPILVSCLWHTGDTWGGSCVVVEPSAVFVSRHFSGFAILDPQCSDLMSVPQEPSQPDPASWDASPARFGLESYPNPFNPMTSITFDLPTASPVRLEVFDARGRSVATLLDDELGAGLHEVTFDGSRLASGTYMYRLSGPYFLRSGKMQLVK